MDSRKAWFKVKLTFCLIILAMILMRLIWIQLRDFNYSADLASLIAIETTTSSSATTRGCKDSSGLLKTQAQDLGLNPGWQQWSLGHLSPIGLRWWLEFSGCIDGEFRPNVLRRYNQNLFLLMVFLSALMARFITGGWVFAILMTLALLSRGRFINSIGYFSNQIPVSMLVTWFLCSMIHYLRTGWLYSLYLSLILAAIGGLFEPAVMLLGFTIPCLVLLWRLTKFKQPLQGLVAGVRHTSHNSSGFWAKVRLALGMHRHLHLGPSCKPQQPSAFLPIEIPFSTWILQDKRWYQHMMAYGIVLTVFTIAISYGYFNFYSYYGLHLANFWQSSWFEPDHILDWLQMLHSLIDLDLFWALIFIGLAVISPRDIALPGLPDICTSLIIALLLVTAGCFIADGITLALLDFHGYEHLMDAQKRSYDILMWFEPSLLCAGSLGLLNIIKISENLIFGRQKT